MSKSRVRTAIFPVAGLGSRFLPATKATPKELLPVIDRPLIQYAIDEARQAGIERMVFVSHPSKAAIERYVTDDQELVSMLRSKGKHDVAARLQRDALNPLRNDVVFAMQDEPLGLGHAVLCARDHVLDGPIAVILPDDLILCRGGCLSEMIAAYEREPAGHMIAVMDVAPEEVSSYGVFDVTAREGRIVRARAMVEKPKPEEAPSTTAVVGRYVLDPSIFDDLADLPPGAGGEIQLTDGIVRAIDRLGLAGFYLSGTRYDCGSKAGMLAATLEIASQSAELCEVIDAFMAARRSWQAA